MRRGWHNDWDGLEKRVWTAVAVGWVVFLAAPLITDVPWNWVQNWVGLHALIYAVMWLRRMLQKPTGKERDR